MDQTLVPVAGRVRRYLQSHRFFRSRATRRQYEELLSLSSRTQSLDELLMVVPQRLREVLQLSSFHLFLRESNRYALQGVASRGAPALSLPSSASTVARMKRDRKPALFISEQTPGIEPDSWQLLATPLEIEILTSLKAQVLVPLEGRTGLAGFATIGRHPSQTFSSSELRFLRHLGSQMGKGLETALFVRSLSAQAVAKARADRELELAREVQERLLPDELPAVPGVDVAAAYRSAERIGGDYYDVFVTVDGVICVVVADVSGKGLSASLLMATLRASLHALMLQSGMPLKRLMEELNTLMYEASAASRYATVFVGLYNPMSQSLSYINAGHNPPLLLRADGNVQRLTTGGTVIGLIPLTSYEVETLFLGTNETLIAYTDGVTEAENDKAVQWGEPRLLEAARDLESNSGSAQQLSQAILARLDTFVAGSAPIDDITLVILRSILRN